MGMHTVAGGQGLGTAEAGMKTVSMKAPFLNGPEHIIVVGMRSFNLGVLGRRAKDLGGVMRGDEHESQLSRPWQQGPPEALHPKRGGHLGGM